MGVGIVASAGTSSRMWALELGAGGTEPEGVMGGWFRVAGEILSPFAECVTAAGRASRYSSGMRIRGEATLRDDAFVVWRRSGGW